MRLFKKLFIIFSVFVFGLVLTGCKEEATIELLQTEITMEVGDTKTIRYTAFPVDAEVYWKTDKPTIVEVSATEVRALKEGKATVYTILGDLKYEVKVTVLPNKEMITVRFYCEEIDDIEPIEIEKGGKISPPDLNFEKEGYRFSGWYLENEKFDFDTVIMDDITLVGRWHLIVDYFKVTFDANGGSEVDSAMVLNQTAVYRPSDPMKRGYIFIDWYLDDTPYDFDTLVSKDMTLVAKWEKKTKAIVTFETFGGTEIPSQTVNIDSIALRPSIDPEKQGYEFYEWYGDYDLETVADFSLPIEDDTIFYAKYAPLRNTPYVVEHRVLRDGRYRLQDTDNMIGTTGSVATYTPKEYQNHVLKVFPKIQIIKGDGTTKVVLNYDLIEPYNYKLDYTGGNSIYHTRAELIEDFLVDFNSYRQAIGSTTVTLAMIDSWEVWSPLDMHTFMYSNYRDKWLWLAEYLGQVGSSSNAGSCRLLVKYKTLDEFNQKANASVDKYAIEYEFRAFVLGKQFTKNANFYSSDYSIYSLANGYGSALAKYRMNTEFYNVSERRVLPLDIYREGFTLVGWYDNPNFEGESITNIITGGTYYIKWALNNPISKIVVDNPVSVLNKGETHQLRWSVLPSNVLINDVIITSTDPKVVNVDKTGLLKADNYGTSRITVISAINQRVYYIFDVTVPAEDGIEVWFNPEFNGTLKVGQTALMLPAHYGTLKGEDMVFESSDPSVIFVERAQFTGKALGDAVITVRNKNYEFSFSVSVIEELSDGVLLERALKLLINAHQPIVKPKNVVLMYDPGGLGTLYDPRYENVNRYLFDDLVIDSTFLLDPNVYQTHGGPMSSIEFVVVHDTANPNAGAYNHGNFFKNSETVSIHYIVGDGKVYSSLPEGYIGFHGGGYENITPETEFAWLDTRVPADEGIPVIDINKYGYFTINGKASIIAAPRGLNNEILDKSYFTDLGPAWKIHKDRYFLGKTHFNTTQTSRGVIANYGGSGNGIGIEMCVNTTGNIIDTWQRNAKLVANILVRNNLGLDRVKMHNTFDGKNCPCSLRKTNYWNEFMEMVEIEYLFATRLRNVKVSMESHTPDLLSDTGSIKGFPKDTSVVSYTITVEANGATRSITLSSLVYGTTTWRQFKGYYK